MNTKNQTLTIESIYQTIYDISFYDRYIRKFTIYHFTIDISDEYDISDFTIDTLSNTHPQWFKKMASNNNLLPLFLICINPEIILI